MAKHPGLERWHAYMGGSHDPAVLDGLIAADAVFHSPVVHTPQAGKAKVMMYLTAAAHVLGNDSFQYVRELVDGDDALLEFTAEIDGIQINGIDLVHFDSHGNINDFKVMVRPLKAVNKLWELMAAQLQAAQ